jgi:hypothetical protein
MPNKLSTVVGAFRELNLYQAKRFSEMLLCQLELQVEGELQCKVNGHVLDQKDVKEAIAETLVHLLHESTNDKLSNDLRDMYGLHLLAAAS